MLEWCMERRDGDWVGRCPQKRDRVWGGVVRFVTTLLRFSWGNGKVVGRGQE